jgi:putative membrane protein
MAEAKRLLVLNVDIDDDLGQKAGLKGPLIGRKTNFEAAAKLATADPEESDSNAIFKAVKIFDELSSEHDCEIATLTGHPSLGYRADRNVVEQLEKVLAGFPAEACVFVSDGASDDQVIPLIQSRIRINSVQTVTVKQTKELEKTYFVILEKLKEPHYARIVFGIPGIALLLYFLLQDFGIRLFVLLLGTYLLVKGFGIEETLFRSLANFRFSFDRISTVFYFAALPLVVVSLYLGFDHAVNSGPANVGKLVAESAKVTLLLLPAAMLLIIIGNALQALAEKKRYLLPDHLMQASFVLLLWLVGNVATDWVLGNAYFSDFLYALLLGTAAIFLVSHFSRRLKETMVAGMSLEGKDVFTEIGSLIGKIVGINRKRGTFVVQTASGQKLDFEFDYISRVADKIIIRY